MSNNRTLAIFPSAVFTTTTNGTAMMAAVGPALPLAPAGAVTHAASSMKVFFEATVITSTQASLDFKIQGRPVVGSGNWFDLQPLVGSASAVWTQVTNTTGGQVRRYMGPIPAEIRAVMTTAGTSPNYTAAAWAVLGE